MRNYFLTIVLMSIAVFGYAQPEFTSLSGPTGGNIIQIERTSANKLFALTDQVLYESTNNGNSWDQNSLNLQNQGPVGLYIDNTNKIYVATKQNIHSSTDAGATWTSIMAGGDYNPAKRFQKNEITGSLFVIGYYEVGDFYGLQKSADDGLTWADISPVANQINDFAIKNSGPSGQIFVSPNGGGSFMFKSTDDGVGWTDSDAGLPNSVSFNYEPGIVVNKSNGKIYCIPYSATGVYESSDNGATWSSVSVGSTITFGNASSIYSIFASQTSDRIYARADNDLYYINTPVTVSTAWTQANIGNSDPVGYLLSNSSNTHVGLNNQFRKGDGIIRSTNGGSTWTNASVGIFEYESRSFVRADNGRLIVVNGGGTITSSTNNGSTWSKLKECDCGFNSLIRKSNNDLLVIGDRTYISTDDGGNWNPLGGTHPDFISRVVSGDGGSTLFGIGGIGSVKIYKSDDGGETFIDIGVTIAGTPEFAVLAADNTNNLYAATASFDVYKIVGSTPTQIANSGITNIRDIATVGANVYIVGEDNSNNTLLAKSTNQGSSWTTKSIDEASQIRMISDDLIFARDFDNKITYSNDAGLNWDVIFDPEISGVAISEVEVDENGIAYVGITQGPMYKSASSVVRPNKPTDLKQVGAANNVVYLEWDYDNSGGAIVEAFDIQRRPMGTGEFEKVGEAESNDLYFADRTTTKNTDYDYRLAAQNDAGENISDEITLTTTDDCAMTIPDNRSWSGSVDGGAFTVPAISIKKFSNDYYKISDVTAGSLDGIAFLGGGTMNLASVTTVFSEACGAPFIERDSDGDIYPNGNGTWNGSNTITLKFQADKSQYVDTEKVITLTLNTDDPVPADPTDLSAYVVSNTQIELQWTAGDFQQKYIVERSVNTNGAFTQIGTVDYPTLKFVDSGSLTAGTTYFYRIKARNLNTSPDESGYSDEVSVVFNKPIFVLSSTIVSSTIGSAPSAAWGDLNNDGFEDLIMPKLEVLNNGVSEPLLFKNNGGNDFQLLTGKLPQGKNLVSPVVADYNNDGKLDVFITAAAFEGSGASGLKNVLAKNDGDFNFTNVDNSVALDQVPGESTLSSSWVDVNSNGFLDLFIPYQDADGQKLFAGSSSGNFTENSTAGSLLTDSFSKGPAFWADYDNDGDMDVFILNNGSSNPCRLYQNDGGLFSRVTPTEFDTNLGNFFTASWGDYNNDQFLDLFVGDQEGGKNYLYKNNGDGSFTKIVDTPNSPSETLGSSSAGSAWGDVDNDGYLDLLVASAGEPNLFYLNQGNGTFIKVTNEAITGYNNGFNLGVAFADYDNDGHLDVVIGSLNFPSEDFSVLGDDPQIKLFKNNLTTGNWIKIKLNGAGGPKAAVSNRSAIGSRIKIVAGGKTQIREISSLTGFGSQNSLIAHFGLGSETTITSIDVRFPSGNTKTLTNVNANQLLVIDEDDEGPQISTFTAANQDKGFGQYDITLTSVDAVSTAGLDFVFRPISETSFDTHAMSKVSSGSNDWVITVSEDMYDDMGMEFYFEAADPFGNKTRSPATGNYYSYLNYKDTNAPKFPTTSLVFGGTDKTWNIISIPFDLGSSATVTSVLDELGSFDNTLWRLLTYQNQTEWAEFPGTFSSFTRGKGYFLNVKVPPSEGITISAEILAPENNQSNLFTIDLNQGWNQIGNPYLVNVPWADIKAFNSTVTGVGDLKVYNSNGRSYENGTVLEVYGGGFVFANQAVTGYKIPFEGQTTGGRKKEARIISTELDNENWRTMFNLKQLDIEFTLGGVGMSPDAKLSYDDNDDVTVPRLTDYLEMNFHHPEHFAKRFSRDVVPTQDEYTWEFTVDSNLKGNSTLMWDNSGFGLNEKEIYLFDITAQKPINMRETNSYAFNGETSKRFKVYFGEDLGKKLHPDRIVLGQAYPNPATHVAVIPFTLPESTGVFGVRLEVYDMMGRKVSVLQDGFLPSGFYESLWDTNDQQLRSGLYTYKLSVSGNGTSEVFSNKIILKK